LDDKSALILKLKSDLRSARSLLDSRTTTITSLDIALREKQTSSTTTRNRLYAVQKQAERAKKTLKETKAAYDSLRKWKPTMRGQYTAAARELARNLIHAGCAAGKVEFAVRSCAEAFGIKIGSRFMSRRTVSRAIDEGGKYGEIQLAREIMDAPGMFLSSFGTFWCI
jgi:hypothetical protein